MVNVSITPFDITLGTGKMKGWCQESIPPDLVFQPVLIMLTTPMPTSGTVLLGLRVKMPVNVLYALYMTPRKQLQGYSCFRLGETRVLTTTSANISISEDKGQSSATFLLPAVEKLLKDSERDGSTFVFITSGRSILWLVLIMALLL